jgi:hypothetical protein
MARPGLMTVLHDQGPRRRDTCRWVHGFRHAVRSRPDTTPKSTALVSQQKESEMGAIETTTKRSFTSHEAQAIATELGVDFKRLGCDVEQFRMGLDVELEHGSRSAETDVSGNDPLVTGKIALAHLTEFPDYYSRLALLERQAAAHAGKQR